MAPSPSRNSAKQKKKQINPSASSAAGTLKVKNDMGKTTSPKKKKKKEKKNDNTKKKVKDVSRSKHQCFQRRWRPSHIRKLKEEMIESLRNCQVLIVVADSYSLKTSYIPLYLADAGFAADPNKRIACTLTRLDIAIQAAKTAAIDAGCSGYKVSHRAPSQEVGCFGTVLIFMSVDCLLQEMAAKDENLSSYSLVIVDDAHERTLGTDLLLGSLLPLLVRRSAPTDILRLVVTVAPSAAHEATKFSAFFSRHCCTKTCILTNNPPTRPLISYIDPTSIGGHDEDDPLEVAMSVVLQVHRHEPAHGSILLFLAGDSVEVLEKACLSMKNRIASSSNPQDKTLLVHPLYLGSDLELRFTYGEAIRFPGRRSLLILSPEVADTRLEIFAVRHVVDPGIGKHGARISQQSANDRAAHLALAAPTWGETKCFRLYTETVYQNEMPPTNLPEILTCGVEELSAALRLMKQLGVASPSTFDFIDPPPPQALASAMEMVAAFPDISRLSLHG